MVDVDKSFMRSLCMGVIEEQIIVPFPRVQEDQRETLHGVIDSLKQLLGPRAEDFRKWDRAGEMPLEFVEQHDDLIVLRNSSCPVRSCAEGNHAMCDADREAIETLLGLPVLQSSTVATGGDSCEYVVQRPSVREPASAARAEEVNHRRSSSTAG